MKKCGCGGDVKREGRGCRRAFVCQGCRRPLKFVYRRKEKAAAEADRRLRRKKRGARNGGGAHGARPTKGAAHQVRRYTTWFGRRVEVLGWDMASGPDRSVVVVRRGSTIVWVR